MLWGRNTSTGHAILQFGAVLGIGPSAKKLSSGDIICSRRAFYRHRAFFRDGFWKITVKKEFHD
jgi:hypothetical protein